MVYGLLILPSLEMIKLQVDREIALVALPVIIVVSLGVPAWLPLRFLRNHQLETGFLPLGRRGWYPSWQVPLLIVSSGIASAVVGPLRGISPGEDSPLRKTRVQAVRFCPRYSYCSPISSSDHSSSY